VTNKRKVLADRITGALDIAYEWSGIDGGHHQQWVIDQMIRQLLGSEENYQKWVANYENDGEYEWHPGIAP
jgi:hypothetical protein